MSGAFPADCPHVRRILTALVFARASTGRLCEEFPAYSSVLLRLASLTLGPL